MIFKYVIFFFCFHCSCTLSINNINIAENICSERLEIFSEMNSRFFRCAILNSEPVKLCQHCVEHFVNTTLTYKNLTTKVDNLNCKDFYVDLDRLNIVDTIYSQTWQLWEKGFCRDCFNWDDNKKFQTPSNDTQKFYGYLDDTMDCIKLNYGDACNKCSAHYLILNDFYNSLNKAKDSKICFDIQDNMNKTRSFWSQEMTCCKERKSSFTMFTIISSLFSLIPVLFYFAYYLRSLRLDHSNYLTNDDFPENELTPSQSRQEIASTTSNEINEPEPGFYVNIRDQVGTSREVNIPNQPIITN